jgi:hypothetical protein
MVGFLRNNFAGELYQCDYAGNDPLMILDALDSYRLSLCQRSGNVSERFEFEFERTNRTLRLPRDSDFIDLRRFRLDDAQLTIMLSTTNPLTLRTRTTRKNHQNDIFVNKFFDDDFHHFRVKRSVLGESRNGDDTTALPRNQPDSAGSDSARKNGPPSVTKSKAYSQTKGESSANRLLNIAHMLHYCSIGILAVFVIQVSELGTRALK